jgi:hypothetical protein
MTPTKRLLLGAALGFLLQVLAFILNIPEGQTQIAFALNASVLCLIPGIGGIIAALVPPFLWGTYYYFLPAIRPKRRTGVLVIILLLHMASVMWLAVTDEISVRVAARDMPIFLVAYLVVASVAFCRLIGFAFSRTTSPNTKPACQP